MADCVRRGGSRRGRGLGFGRAGWLVVRGWWSGSWGLSSVLEAAGEVGYFCIVEGAGCLLVEGSESVGNVLDAFVLEPAGYAVEGTVAVAWCVVVLHAGLDGFVNHQYGSATDLKDHPAKPSHTAVDSMLPFYVNTL